MKDKLLVGLGGLALLAIVVSGVALGNKLTNSDSPLGSVQQGSEYHATSTPLALVADTYYLTKNSGVLGSIVITSSSVGNFIVSDADGATTGTAYTIAGGQAEGTFTFDANMYNGIAITVPANHNGHIVTTWR